MKGGTLELITAIDAARLCGLTKEAVYAAIRAGTLRADKLGDIYVITRAEYDRWRATVRPYRKRARTPDEGARDDG